MIYEAIPPCEALKELISHFWVATWEAFPERPETTHYVIASSLTDFTFAFSGSSAPAAFLFSIVQGHTHLPRQYAVDGFRHLIGVSFYSHALPHLFDVSAIDFNGECMPVSKFLGSKGAILNEQMTQAVSTQQRIQLLSSCFISLLKKRKAEDALIMQAIREIKKRKGNVRIEALASDFCLSPKQFSRRFREFSGFNPKMYARILRFESLISNYTVAASLIDAAYEHDYHDQAHFIHEFKSFTGFAPRDFLKLSENGI